MTGILWFRVAYAGDCDEWVAKVVSVQGSVQAKKTGTTRWVPVRLHDTFCPGDMLRVLKRSRAAVVLANESVARLDKNTTVTFTGVAEKKVSLIDMLRGAAHFFSRVPRSLKVTTPFVNGAVEGTEFYVEVGSDQTLLSVFRGRVFAANAAGSINLADGQSAMARAGTAPVEYLLVNPRDAVRWAVYYPAVTDHKVAVFEGSGDSWQGKVRRSIRFFREGDLVNAFSSLKNVPEDIADARFYAYRAGLLLTVGRVDEAAFDIKKALQMDAANGHAMALKSIIAVAQNRKQDARRLAEAAAANDPDSAAARVALSYAQQAVFDVEGALESLKAAVRLSPESALAHARLSELWMSVGDLDKALETAQRAIALNPHLARTQTVLGFAWLAQIKTTDAMAAFEKAISLDSAAPLPRLGLGLARIRAGDLKPGRAELEIAAGLDPNNSLIRSYLGKAFFDEKQDKQSGRQLAVAKELDPQDPTPWFYDAVRKQTLNRPVEALHDLQRSIELNDNRAVYRSELLLDEDLAARSASLGRIYNDLGFQQLALVEGWKSLNTDPYSYSAHRLLADSYADLPRHEIARVSERLQSQLLQPINISPVQPSLSESETFIYEGSGPADASFDEYHALFLRDRLALQTSGVVGGNDTYGDEVVHSGVWGRMSYSIGQFHYETDGFRTNNDLDLDIFNLFAQVSLTHKTSIQIEYRDKDDNYGDLTLRFYPDNYSPNRRTDRERNYTRLGFHHAFGPRSDLIGFIARQSMKSEVFSSATSGAGPVSVELDVDITGNEDDAYTAELRHLYRSERFSITSGAGHFRTDFERSMTMTQTITINLPPPFGSTTTTTTVFPTESDIRHSNLYVYSFINYPENVTWTMGASGDFYEKTGILETDQFNPKFGFTWEPFPETTIRGAVFRVLKREMISDQTIEPTQVAGFNQFFDENNATDAWRYGIGIDQKFSETLYGGAEFTARDLKTPIEEYSGTTVTAHRADWEENLLRVYLNWTPCSWLAASGEYSHERFNRDEDIGDLGISNVDTHKVSIRGNLFHPSGLRAGVTATYVNQEGSFSDAGFLTISDDSNVFWVFDASAGYRLPKRWGILTVEGKNLLDKAFRFQETDPAYPRVYPERRILARLTLAF